MGISIQKIVGGLLVATTALAGMPVNATNVQYTSATVLHDAEQSLIAFSDKDAFLAKFNYLVATYPHLKFDFQKVAAQIRPDLKDVIFEVKRGRGKTADRMDPAEEFSAPDIPASAAKSSGGEWLLGGLVLAGIGGAAAVLGGGSSSSKSGSSSGDGASGPDNGGGDEDGDTGENRGNNPPSEPTASDFRTIEFERNRGNLTLRAHHAYAKGATGQGVLIGILDDGIEQSTLGSQLSGRINLQREYVAQEDGAEGHHAGFIANLLIGQKDGVKSHGIAFGATVNDYKISDEFGSFARTSVIAQALDDARTDGVSVVNMSFGSINSRGHPSNTEARAIDATFAEEFAALNQYHSDSSSGYRGTLAVIAAGNDGSDHPNFESLFPFYRPELEDVMLTVVALSDDYDPRDFAASDLQLAEFSNRCGAAANWCLAAPGQNLLSERSNDVSRNGSGTSFATPFVAGAAAILLEAFPALAVEEVRQILLDTAVDLGVEGVDEVFGHGLVDLAAAMLPVGAQQSFDRTGASYRSSDTESGMFSDGGGYAITRTAIPIPAFDAYDREFWSVRQIGSITEDALRLKRGLDQFSIDLQGTDEGYSGESITVGTYSVSFSDHDGHEMRGANNKLDFVGLGLSSDGQSAVHLSPLEGHGLSLFVSFSDDDFIVAPGYSYSKGNLNTLFYLPMRREVGRILGEEGRGLFSTRGETYSVGLAARVDYSPIAAVTFNVTSAIVKMQFDQTGTGIVDKLDGVAATIDLSASYSANWFDVGASLKAPLQLISGEADLVYFAPRVGLKRQNVNVSSNQEVQAVAQGNVRVGRKTVIGFKGFFDPMANAPADLFLGLTRRF